MRISSPCGLSALTLEWPMYCNNGMPIVLRHLKTESKKMQSSRCTATGVKWNHGCHYCTNSKRLADTLKSHSMNCYRARVMHHTRTHTRTASCSTISVDRKTSRFAHVVILCPIFTWAYFVHSSRSI